MMTIWQESALEGIWNTLCSYANSTGGYGHLHLGHFHSHLSSFFSKMDSTLRTFFLIVMRTTPEYILAYLFVLLWGPSMLPCILALALHNGAILGFLSGQHTNALSLAIDSSAKKVNRYFFEVLLEFMVISSHFYFIVGKS